MKRLITIAFILLITISSFGQGHGQGLGQWKNKETKNRHEQIVSAKIAFFTTEIGITPEEAKSFWPVYNKYWDEFSKASNETRTSLRELRKLDKAGNTSDVDFRKATQLYIDNMKKEIAIQELYLPEFYKILSPAKVAKLLLAEDSFRFKLMDMLKGMTKPSKPEEAPTPSN